LKLAEVEKEASTAAAAAERSRMESAQQVVALRDQAHTASRMLSPIEFRVECVPMGKRSQPDGQMLKGTLDMMILRTLATGDAHGHTLPK
jgi:hypothetical protein